MSKRLLAHLSVVEWEKLFDEKRDNRDFLVTLLDELSHRKRPRAHALRRRVLQALSVARPTSKAEPTPFRMTPAEHRQAAEDYRRRARKWSGEQAAAAHKLAQAHEALADQIERQLAKKS